MKKIKIRIHEHNTWHDCDDCGLTSSSIFKLSGSCGSFSHGEAAYCYGIEEGEIEVVIVELFKRLQTMGIDAKIPEIRDHDTQSVLDYDTFIYNDGFVHYLRSLGVDVKMTYSTEKMPETYGDDDFEIEEIDDESE